MATVFVNFKPDFPDRILKNPKERTEFEASIFRIYKTWRERISLN
ncbi:hypothetical protein LEP1GSC061_2906 [Leptospira wolffii serovar Khorat str. Khorat-H2]|nr:hypothetical protein LEP1GSC061_2906 [Leptospira wolffii serovar Khorat str. Khorat-H2]